jgi:4-amino-4-deoxy-L-arabinose transferase-like glycosyltransferase
MANGEIEAPFRSAGAAPRAVRFAAGAAVVAVCLFLLFFYRLADRDLWNSHEARAAMDAQTILDDRAWGLPHLFDGRAELQKPPLYYWLVAAAARLRGGVVDAWAVRLPAALAAAGCVGAVALLGLRAGRGRAGLLAALILATAVHFTWLARVGRIDMPLTLTVTVAAGAMYLALSFSREPPASAAPALAGGSRLNAPALKLLSYLATAAGVLLKGPIAVVLPLAIIGAHLLAQGRLPAPWRARAWGRLANELGLGWGVPLVAAMTLPWFLWADAATRGEFSRVFIWYHNVERGFGGDVLRAHPWWFYGPRFAIDFLPWTPLLLGGVYVTCCRGRWRADPEACFGLVWLMAVLVLLSCFRYKRADYLLPAYPGAALFLGCALSPRREGAVESDNSWAALALWGTASAAGVAALAWAVYVAWVLPAGEPAREYTRFAAAVRSHAPAPEPVLFFRTESHALAFRVGRPLEILVKWEELNDRLSRPGDHYVVMPDDRAAAWPQFLRGVRLDEVSRNTDLAGGSHEHPLVLLRGRPCRYPEPAVTNP